ncbi:extracellular solute-binding protein [Saccharopolyspora taberi]|uniref:Extracellular solute-binding protein n=1 Tax=Saccharopolyspora taberi TaxID=60895 RepID=A0ABN3VHH4_9PSEU
MATVTGGVGSAHLRIVHPWTEEAVRGLQCLVDDFVAEHHDVSVELDAVPTGDWYEFHNKILMRMAAGTAPDLVYVVSEHLGLFAQRLAEPLDALVLRDGDELREYFSDVHPLLVESMMYEGSLFELPIEFNAANIFYNTEWFERAGVSRPPDDWSRDDFYDIARKLAAAGLPGTSYGWVNRLWGGVLPWMYAAGASLLEETHEGDGAWLWGEFYPDEPSAVGRGGGWRWGTPRANDARNVEALRFLADLTREGLSLEAGEGGGGTRFGQRWVGTVADEFLAGRLGMSPAGGFWTGELHRSGMAPGAFDVQYFPRWTTQRHEFGAAGYAITKQARDKELAWEWVKFSASRAAMERTFVGNESTPSRRSMVTASQYEWSGPRHWEVFYRTLERFPDSAPVPGPPTTAALTATFTKYVDLAMSGKMSAKHALDELQHALERMSRWY